MEEEIENLDYSRPNLFTKETISTVLEYARTVEPRSHMIELKHYPTMFAIIEMKEDGTHNLHIRRQDAIIEEPISAQAFIDLGYNWYIEDARDGPQNLYSIEDFRLLHNHIQIRLMMLSVIIMVLCVLLLHQINTFSRTKMSLYYILVIF